MPYRFRPGVAPEQSLEEIEKEFSLENIVDIPINSSFPEAGIDKGQFSIVKDGGTYYYILLAEGKRLRIPFTEF